MACALGVFAGTKAELETQFDPGREMPLFWVEGGGSCGHDGPDNSQGEGLLLLDWGILDPISFDMAGDTRVQADVSLGFGGGFWG